MRDKVVLLSCVQVTVLVFIVLAIKANAECGPGEPQYGARDPKPLIDNPDAFAWNIFTEINTPADPNNPDGPVAWEQWALARRVYEDPNLRVDLTSDEKLHKLWQMMSTGGRSANDTELSGKQRAFLKAKLALETGRPVAPSAQFDPGVAAGNEDDEVRMNEPAFRYVMAHDLYSVEGQERMFDRRERIDFPKDAREIKAKWKKLGPLDDLVRFQKNYHTAVFERKDGDKVTKEIWGLAGLHITTKDLPNWLWATWEHKENPSRETVLPSRDAAGLPPNLRGTKWENYVLRGTQLDFTDSIGRPILLANSLIEEGFQDTSSCITCHAKASIGPRRRKSDEPNRLPIFEVQEQTRVVGSIGRPMPDWFTGGLTWPVATKYWQTDFVWSVMRAKRKAPAARTGVSSAFRGAALDRLIGTWTYRSFVNDPAVSFDLDKLKKIDSVEPKDPAVAEATRRTIQTLSRYIFGQGTLEIQTIDHESGSVTGVLTWPGGTLPLKGTIAYDQSRGAAEQIELSGVGQENLGTKDYEYRYRGYLVPRWDASDPPVVTARQQIDAIVGSIVRVKARPGAPAGVVASWIAVKQTPAKH